LTGKDCVEDLENMENSGNFILPDL